MKSNKKLAIIIGSIVAIISTVAAIVGFFVYFKKNFSNLFPGFPEEEDFSLEDSL